MNGRSHGSHLIAMDDSDEALMARVARGDERAFQLLSRRHLPAMLGLARRILRNSAEAEDVAQEAFIHVWTHAPRWQPLAQFRTWLTRVVVNLCLDRKRRVPWVELEAAGDIVDPRPVLARRQRAMSARVCWRPQLTNFLRGAQRNRAHLRRRHEQCAGGGNSRHVGVRRRDPLVRGKQNLRRALGDRSIRMSEMTNEQFENFSKPR